MNNKIYVSIREASMMSGVSQHHIRDLIKANKIRFIPSGVKYLVNYPKMMEYFETLEVAC